MLLLLLYIHLSFGGDNLADGEENGDLDGTAEVGIYHRIEDLHLAREAHICVNYRRHTLTSRGKQTLQKCKIFDKILAPKRALSRLNL